eukprot:scaffold106511_cov90-Phaeocystis_antarctica.AAC.2
MNATIRRPVASWSSRNGGSVSLNQPACRCTCSGTTGSLPCVEYRPLPHPWMCPAPTFGGSPWNESNPSHRVLVPVCLASMLMLPPSRTPNSMFSALVPRSEGGTKVYAFRSCILASPPGTSSDRSTCCCARNSALQQPGK